MSEKCLVKENFGDMRVVDEVYEVYYFYLLILCCIYD